MWIPASWRSGSSSRRRRTGHGRVICSYSYSYSFSYSCYVVITLSNDNNVMYHERQAREGGAMSCSIHTHAPARTTSTSFILYPSVLRTCSANYPGRGHGYECRSPGKALARRCQDMVHGADHGLIHAHKTETTKRFMRTAKRELEYRIPRLHYPVNLFTSLFIILMSFSFHCLSLSLD